MARLQIELRDVFGHRNFKVRLDENALTQQLLQEVLNKESQANAYDFSEDRFLYDPHRALLDLSKSLLQNGVKDGDRLRYYFPTLQFHFDDIEIQPDFADEITVLEESDLLNIKIDGNVDNQIVIEENGNPVTININTSTLSIVQGDITRQLTDAIVNAAKPSLSSGGGVDKSIHDVSGPDLVKASRDLAPCRPGDAVITPGFHLMSNWVIHTVGPIYEGGNKNESKILSLAYRNSLNIALNSNFDSISFPSLSTGHYGYPVKEASEVALRTIIEVLSRTEKSILVFIVLYSYSDFIAYQNTLKWIKTES